ncbi:hypothetical protein HPB52_003311 [Rhipicephalus sanguineus]|uniref:THAP-type domain-containing protein n=1 Tax=Rhipicephalus sanguineus TaxID=34632 RepID=A0A9D4QIL4_RHISA|nr:hypothetical protein HPB52_003311 [Rhipicephalus sanguineus]
MIAASAATLPSPSPKAARKPAVRVPVEINLREKWLQAIARDNWVPTLTSNCSVVCSLRFQECDFKGSCQIRRRLKPGEFMEAIRKWFTCMDVSNLQQHIHRNDEDTRQFSDTDDPRLNDPIESMFGFLRRSAGCKDALDVRSSVCGIEKMLKTGILRPKQREKLELVFIGPASAS